MLFGHGGDVYSLSRELGLDPTEVLDFSSNCSPLPYPEGFTQYLYENIEQLHLLPEVDSYSVRTRLAERYGLDEDCFLLGSGTTQWIYSLPRILGARRAFIPLPTYADYGDASRAAGLEVQYYGPYIDGTKESAQRFLSDFESLEGRSSGDSMVFVCNPNNPTGLFIDPDRLLDLAKSIPEVTWIIDEAYAPFVSSDTKSSLLVRDISPNVVVLRSFSKIYGIPGLRIGCLVAKGTIIEKLRSHERPWAVNRMAQLAANFLLQVPEYEEEVRTYCQHEKKRIVSGLSTIKALTYVEGKTHFALFEVNRPLDADTISQVLKKRAMLVRNCANFPGLSGEFVRISPRMSKENLTLIAALKELADTA